MKRVLLILITCLLVTGCSVEAKKTEIEIKDNSNITIIKSYMKAVAKKDYEEITKNLSGEALKGHRKSINSHYNMKILDESYKAIIEGRNIQVIEGLYTIELISKENRRYITKEKYRFYLRNIYEKWKIYKIEELKIPIIKSAEGTNFDSAISSVKEYIIKVSKGKWDEAATYLAGDSLKEGLKILESKNILKMTISDLDIKVLDGNENSAFIIANYRVKAFENIKSVTLIFYVEKIDGYWRIFDITEG